MAQVRVTVDGVQYVDEVEPRMLLVYYLRERLGKTGTVVGCDTSNCGACTVHLNGQSVKSCAVLAVQADGGEVTTIEGLARDGQLHPVQKAFNECHALQCGFCTPGMIMQVVDLLGDNPDPDEHEVREGIEGNLCRCTGYQNIVRAVQSAAQAMKPGVAAARGDQPATGGREPDRDDDRRTHHRRTRSIPHPQGGRPPHHRAHALDRQHRSARAPAPVRGALARRARPDHRDRHRGGPAAARRPRRLHRPRPRRRGDRPALRLDDRARSEGAAAATARRRHGALRRRGRRHHRRPGRRHRPRRERAGRRRLRRPAAGAGHGGGRRRGRDAAAPGPRHQRQRALRLRLGEAGTGDDADRLDRRRRDRPRLDRRPPPLPPAAADPGLHGAALGGRRPDRRAVRHLVVDAGAALRQDLHVAAHGHSRAQAAGDRAGRRRRLRREAAGDARGDALHPRRASSSAGR